MWKLVIFFWNILISTSLHASPATFTYQGRILRNDGAPLESPNVAFEFTILSPDGSCILYREQRNGVDMRNSKGVFDTPIGSGSKSFPPGPSTSLLDIFNNSTSLPCDGGATYAPQVDHGRVLRVQFYDGTSWRLISPDNIVRSVPFSAYASSATTAAKLGVYQATDFILKTGVNGGANCDSGSFITWDSVSKTFGCAPASGAGTVTGVTSANSYLAVTNQTTTPVLTLNVGTVANTVAAGNDARFTNARIPTGAAAGDLGGNYPNPSVEKIKGLGIDFAIAPSSGQVLTFDGTNWTSQNLPASSGGTVTSITAGTGLTGGSITGSGTIGLGPELAAIHGIAGTGFIQKTGSATYGTMAGATAASNNTLVQRDGSGVSGFYGLGISGASSGAVTLRAPAITSNYSLTFPNAQGGLNQVLSNNGSGVLSWASVPTAPGAACSAGNVISYNGTSFICVPDQTGASGSGITTFNGASGSSQSLDVGVVGNAPAWSTANDVHTLNIPLASAAGTVTAGLISNAEYQFFSNKQPALGYTPLNRANNLSDVVDVALARSNLALGTAATKNIAASGDATAAEVVLGNDSRLTDSRTPSGTASGDLSGAYPNPTVAKINGVSLLYSSLTSGQYLKYNGTNWINSTIATSDISGLSTTYVGKDQIASCTNKQTLGYVSVSDTWSCQNISIDDTQIIYASQAQKTFLAAPTGASGTPTFRTIAATDLPSSVSDGLWAATAGNVYRATGNVGIGVTNPTAPLHVNGEIVSSMSNAWATVTARSYSPDGDDIPMIRMQRSRGTESSPSSLLSGDVLGYLLFQSYTGSAMNGWRAAVSSSATQNHADDAYGTRLQFSTTSNNSNSMLPRMTIDHNGYVGVGTATPAVPLTIKSSTYPVGITQNQVGGDAAMELTTSDASGNQATRIMLRGHTNQNDIEFLRGGRGSEITSMNIKGATGNVGIGTSSPAALLHVAGNAQIDGDVILPGNTAMKGSNTTSYLALYSGTVSTDGGSLLMYGGDHATQPGNIYATYGGGPSGFFQLRYNNGTTTSNILRATSTGNVGIGTTSPGTKLHVYATTGSRVRIEDQNAYWDLWGGNHLIVQRDAVEFFRVSAAGDMGIGTSGPTAKLHVYDSVAGSVVAKFQSGTGTCSVTPNTGMACSSDLRLKEDIQPIPSALGKVAKVNGVTFKWKDRGPADESRHMGFIAQEVEMVAPELVMEDTSGYKQVNYANFVAVLTEAFKEFVALWRKDSDDLHQKYAELKAATDREIATVKNELLVERKRNDELARRLESIENSIRKK